MYPISPIFFTIVVHFCAPKSYTNKSSELLCDPRMDLPSADHRGQQISSGPGSCSIFRVARSRIWMEVTSLPPTVPVWPNAIFVPSADQLGSRSEIAPLVICSAGPPADGIKKMFQGFPGRTPVNAMWLPSGDQCGKDTRSDGPVNCVAPPPSAFARQSVPSG